MKQYVIQSLAVALAMLAVLCEVNLLRIFLGDWRNGRRQRQQRAFPACSKERSSASASARSRVNRCRFAACFLFPALAGSYAHAQQPPTSGQPQPEPSTADQPAAPTEQPESKSPYSLQLNLDCTTAYFYHGIIQEDSGLILQPAAKLTINLLERDDLKLDALVGSWNSFHGEKTAAQTHGDFTEYWYESDLIGGLVLTKGKVSLTGTYTLLTSPSDAYETVQEVDLSVAFDDSEQLGKFALHPYALLGIEVGADASDGADSDTGTYLELGVAPGFTLGSDKTPITVSIPASVGLSLDNYYQNAAGEDDTFGFAQLGVRASLPLPFGERYGKWTLNAGVSAMYLGDHTADLNGGDHEQLIGTIGIQLNF